jgi:hypothetical protein
VKRAPLRVETQQSLRVRSGVLDKVEKDALRMADKLDRVAFAEPVDGPWLARLVVSMAWLGTSHAPWVGEFRMGN